MICAATVAIGPADFRFSKPVVLRLRKIQSNLIGGYSLTFRSGMAGMVRNHLRRTARLPPAGVATGHDWVRNCGKAGNTIMASNPNPVGRPTSYRPEYCDMVVEFMRAGFSLTAFAGHIDVARSTINEWMANFPDFSEAVSRGKAARLLHWEESAIQIAKGNGGPGASTIVVFGLKNMAPDEYSDTVKTELTGANGGPIKHEATLDVSKLSTQALAELMAARGEPEQ